jgi:hypothetical protein
MLYDKLGDFTYHNLRVKLESAQDESEFRISYWEDTISSRSIDWGEPTEVKTTDDLRKARTWFEDTVTNMLMNTSYTDVSIYMQQKAKPG